ncbi:MAG: HDOD domain-containing protein [Desulfobacteraceae bacterium]|nr:HDOD domain-containing protein [Desulfobacteraceae bacterium]
MIPCPQIDFTLEHIFDNLVELPTFPKVVTKALRVLDDPNGTTAQLVEVLKFDPALTANMLRLTNSALFGLPRQVTDLHTALTLLGQIQIREILIASAGAPYLTRPLHGYQMEPEDLWQHSMASALIAELLAKMCEYPDQPVLFTSALLHDIGKIVLNMFVGGRLDEILTLAQQERLTFTEAEWYTMGVDHAVIGSQILMQWDFPPDIARAVRNHHDPDLYIQDDLSSLLALSNILAVQLGLGVGADGFRHKINPKLLTRLGLSRQDMHRCIERALVAYEKSSDIISGYKA